MNENPPIELYKKRTFSERFSAAFEFIGKNWKVFFKILVYVAIPLAIIQGYLSMNTTQGTMEQIQQILSGETPDTATGMSVGEMMKIYFWGLVASILSLMLSAMVGALLLRYKQGRLNPEMSWKDISDKVFPFMGWLFLAELIVALLFIVAFIPIAFLLKENIGLFMIVVFALIIFIIPALCLFSYPIFLDESSAWKAVVKGFRLGFKYWGSTFITFFVLFVFILIISYILAIPSFAYSMFNPGPGIAKFIIAALTSFCSLLLTPIILILMCFQYTSIEANEQGVDVSDQVD